MLRNIFSKTLRDNRAGVLGVGLGLALLLIVGITQYPQLLPSGPDWVRQAAEFTRLMQAFSFLLGEVVPIDTLGGFLTIRILGTVPVMLGLWAVIVAAGLIRGEEELGALDLVLTAPHGRLAVFMQKLAAFGLALLIVLTLMGASMLASVAAIGEMMSAGSILGVLFNTGLQAAFWAALALAVSQLLAARRTVSTVVGGLLFASYLLDNVVETLPSLKGLAWVLPIHAYAANKPLLPGRPLDVAAWLGLGAVTVVVLLLALIMFLRRDLGSVYPLLPARPARVAGPGGGALLGSVFAANLRELLGSTLGWGLGLAALAALLVGTANEAIAPMQDALHNLPWLGQVMGNLATVEGYLSGSLFALPLLLTFFVLLQLASWTGDEESGRLELLVAAPIPRLQVLVARFAAVVCSIAGILALFAAGMLGTAALTNTPLDAGRTVAAAAGSGIVNLVVLAFGLALATWLKQPGGALPIAGSVAVAMFFLDLLASIFNWPEAIRNLSIYHRYGQPLVQGLAWSSMSALLVATLILAVGSLVGFARRDIAK